MKILDLFSGCGGLSLGFQDAGYEPVGAFDAWDLAVQTYNANAKHKATKFDLSDVDGLIEKVKNTDFDMIIGGPPCQDFSSAGKRTEGDRANLTGSYADIITKLRPNYFLMENVARSKHSRAYEAARKKFVAAGYGLTEVTLDASYCGVPQARKRFFCIGIMNEEDGFMDEIINNSLSKKRMTVRDFLGKELDIEHYYRHPRNYSRRAVFSIDEPAATIRGVSRPVPNGYKGHHNDSSKIGANIRALTTYERSRIQTFPKNFKWVGSKTDIEQMIGNAVPVKLASFVANCINKYVTQKTKKSKRAA
jgi:DNA (cytosine-5)-methyltransferase 1